LPGRSLVPGNLPELLRAQIPFTLTEEQEKAVSILNADSASSRRMHRLLQGDVGSGKTIVGLFACLPALNHGLQVAWLAPTEILAQQTFTRLGGWLEKMHISNVLLTGSLVSAKKKEIAADLRLGKILFVVGTHALIQESVSFSQLGMIVIDEQHRFGSQQRLSIQQKDPAADFLLMSATPIPQTLAKTVYGDLDIVTIPSLPARRNPVSTHVVPEEKRSAMDLFVKKELMENGSQAFYVVPRIDSVTDEIKGMKDIETVMKDLERGVLSAVPRAAIHGKIDAEEKARIMRRFAAGEIRLLVATTVVEVGIDVPNATVMIIEHADRFGLSQLHQLRGRVGRGPKKGYAFLLSTIADTEQAHKRLKKFCAVHDGFEIAELDLALRGPGEVSGFRQSGWDELQIADILRDADLFREIQEELDMLLMA
jgi:ATP-dependent DNA helicase RecG